MRVLFWFTTMLALLAILTSCEDAPDSSAKAERYLWVTRWDHRTEADVKRVVADAAGAGFDALVFQVRGAASTLFPSKLEPRAIEVEGAPADYDPLRIALDAARSRDLEVHAWINCVPSWWGTTPPSDPNHVYHTRPDWHWYDQAGKRQKLSERFYVSLNPCLPEVRAHIVAVCEELVTTYELDGLHLDYIRFPNEPPATPKGSVSDWPRDERTLTLYREASGLAPDEDLARWSAWRAEQVTELVRGIRTMLKERRPDIALSSAVGSVPDRARDEHFQDVEGWIEEGLLDLVLPMNYTSDPDLFAERSKLWKAWSTKVPVAMGVMANGDMQARVTEIRHAKSEFSALAVFGYHELFDSANEILVEQSAVEKALRAQRRAVLVPVLKEP